MRIHRLVLSLTVLVAQAAFADEPNEAKATERTSDEVAIERIKQLERRIAELESQIAEQASPVNPPVTPLSPGVSLSWALTDGSKPQVYLYSSPKQSQPESSPAPSALPETSVPENWRRIEFNGYRYFIIPLNGACESVRQKSVAPRTPILHPRPQNIVRSMPQS